MVILLMDALGIRADLYNMARRLGSAGYYVVLPNLYYRRLREFDYRAVSTEIMYEHMHSLSNAMVCDDIQALFRFSARDEMAKSGKAGCVGYCMSGPFAFAAAARFNDRITASASIHGVRLFGDNEDSPHLDAKKIRGEMYFACAEIDDHAPQKMIDDLDDYLSETDINYRIEVYPGTVHGFVFPQREDAYHCDAAERHWERLHSIFQRNLSK